MASVNRVILIGNLGADPEVRYTQGGTAVANMRIATNESWTDKQGNRQERTEWHRVIVWGAQGETCAEYLSKGRSVYVEGRLQTREWTDKEGRKQWTTEIVADKVVFLSTGNDRGERRDSLDSYCGGVGLGRRQHSGPEFPGADDDIPF